MLFLSAVRFFLLPVSCSPKLLAPSQLRWFLSNRWTSRPSSSSRKALSSLLLIQHRTDPPPFLRIGRDAEAVAVVHRIAFTNGKTSALSVADLHNAAVPYFRTEGDGAQMTTKFSTWELVKLSFKDVSGEHVKGLFKTPRLAYSTSLIMFICELECRHEKKSGADSLIPADGALGVSGSGFVLGPSVDLPTYLQLAYPLYNGFLGVRDRHLRSLQLCSFANIALLDRVSSPPRTLPSATPESMRPTVSFFFSFYFNFPLSRLFYALYGRCRPFGDRSDPSARAILSWQKLICPSQKPPTLIKLHVE